MAKSIKKSIKVKVVKKLVKKVEPLKEPDRLEPLKSAEPEDLKDKGEPEDYLRQYQYKKQTVFGSVESDPSEGSKADAMKKFLLSQKRVRMFIPRPMGETKQILQSVNLNGYRLDIPKNTYIEMPEQIAEVLKESLQQTEQALKYKLIEGDKDKETALT